MSEINVAGMDIKNIYDVVIFTSAALTIKDAVIEAVSKKANLREANLRGANLSEANLRGADLSWTDLSGANLRGAKNAELVIARLQFIPIEGAFIGWKKCQNDVIVKLSIPAEAKRSHGSERKCRAEFVDCLEVIGADEGVSINTTDVIYRKGERIVADSWDADRWEICSHGIHFFLTREEAEAYEA